MSQNQQYKPPQKKPPEMSHKDWLDHLEEVKAFDKRLYRQSGGQLGGKPSQGSRPERSS